MRYRTKRLVVGSEGTGWYVVEGDGTEHDIVSGPHDDEAEALGAAASAAADDDQAAAEQSDEFAADLAKYGD